MQVLRGISFEVNKGEVLSVIGPSGSGKSTLLRCCTLLERADAGRIAYDDLVMADTGADGKAEYSPSPVLQQIRAALWPGFSEFQPVSSLFRAAQPDGSAGAVLKVPKKEAEDRPAPCWKRWG